ncbi:MAG: hypothetical protein MI802_17900 [Desulfobacterales bacterium]|nr:hypothetical protein [Desulfobacterales bacterium]
MKELLQLPAEFDYNLLMYALRGYKKPKDKARSLIQSQDIIRVKKGIYVLGPGYNSPYNTHVLANMIYGPSYITGQTALSYWGLIPERVEQVINMTFKRKKRFPTPVGDFSYLYCRKSVYPIGVKLENVGEGKKIFIASPEKALCDLVAVQSHLRLKGDLKEFLDLMRLDDAFFEGCNHVLLDEISSRYGKPNVRRLTTHLRDIHV